MRSIRLGARDLGFKVGLLRLKDSSANSTVAAFTELAKAAVPKILGKKLKATRASKNESKQEP